MAKSHDDGSRIEAAEAGVHAEALEADGQGAHSHVDAVDAVPVAHSAHEVHDTHPRAGAVSAHDAHDAHDDAGGGHGHGADPNAGVVQALPPTPAWVLTAAGIALLTIAICAVLAVMLHNADAEGGGGAPAEEEPAHARISVTSTVTGA